MDNVPIDYTLTTRGLRSRKEWRSLGVENRVDIEEAEKKTSSLGGLERQLGVVSGHAHLVRGLHGKRHRHQRMHLTGQHHGFRVAVNPTGPTYPWRLATLVSMKL